MLDNFNIKRASKIFEPIMNLLELELANLSRHKKTDASLIETLRRRVKMKIKLKD